MRRGLFLVIAALLAASTLVKSFNVAWGNDNIFGLLRLLWVDQEGNLPTWFSSTLLLGGAILAIIIARTTRHEGRPHVSWHVVAGLLLCWPLTKWPPFTKSRLATPSGLRVSACFPRVASPSGGC